MHVRNGHPWDRDRVHFTPKADIGSAGRDVRFVPKAHIIAALSALDIQRFLSTWRAVRLSAPAISSHYSCRDDRQSDNRPYSGSTAPSDLPRLNRQPEFGPARVQGFERAFAFESRELMTKAEVDPRAERNVAVRPPLEIELLGEHVC